MVRTLFRTQEALLSVPEPGGLLFFLVFPWFLQSFEITVGLEWFLAMGCRGFFCVAPREVGDLLTRGALFLFTLMFLYNWSDDGLYSRSKLVARR